MKLSFGDWVQTLNSEDLGLVLRDNGPGRVIVKWDARRPMIQTHGTNELLSVPFEDVRRKRGIR